MAVEDTVRLREVMGLFKSGRAACRERHGDKAEMHFPGALPLRPDGGTEKVFVEGVALLRQAELPDRDGVYVMEKE